MGKINCIFLLFGFYLSVHTRYGLLILGQATLKKIIKMDIIPPKGHKKTCSFVIMYLRK